MGENHINSIQFLDKKHYQKVSIPCDLLIKSVGYKGLEMPGLPFDSEKGIIPNQQGKIEKGLYVAGWIKRGATGVIGANKKCSEETVALMIKDLEEGISIQSDISLPNAVSFKQWQLINDYEKKEGEKYQKPREKCLSISDMMNLVTPNKSAP